MAVARWCLLYLWLVNTNTNLYMPVPSERCHSLISSDSDVPFNQVLYENGVTFTCEKEVKSSAVPPLANIHQDPRLSFRSSIVYASPSLTVDVWDEGKLSKILR